MGPIALARSPRTGDLLQPRAAGIQLSPGCHLAPAWSKLQQQDVGIWAWYIPLHHEWLDVDRLGRLADGVVGWTPDVWWMVWLDGSVNEVPKEGP